MKQIFRHKTKHVKFTVGVPAILLVQVALGVWLTKNVPVEYLRQRVTNLKEK